MCINIYIYIYNYTLYRSASPHFFLHVFPHRVSSDGLQSSVTRASRRAYCAKEPRSEPEKGMRRMYICMYTYVNTYVCIYIYIYM